MKSEQKLNLADSFLISMSNEELNELNGGSFWGDVAFVAGATITCIKVFCKTAIEYQHSLPPNLKK